MLKASVRPQVFNFSFAARTSRGAMRDKKSWFIKIWDDQNPDIAGYGECGPLPGLSPEDLTGLETLLATVAAKLDEANLTIKDFETADLNSLRASLEKHFGASLIQNNPAIAFAWETSLLDLANGGKQLIFENSFLQGNPIPINGLVWMGGLDFMLQQVEIKIRDGFKCIKLKVGGIDFEKELDILQFIRRKYFRDNIIIRLDANGAIKPEEAMGKLSRLAKFEIHSIEQPLKAGASELASLCKTSPIPIALDEELIGVNGTDEKKSLLDKINPPYIILKPMLHGGLHGSQEWIALAEERGIGWWITSALESNIGLNAVSQFSGNYDLKLHQGLGTGSLYTNNIGSPLTVKRGQLLYNNAENWDVSIIN